MRAFLTLLRAAWRYAEGRRWTMALYLGMFVCANIFNLAEPYVIGKLLNSVQGAAELENPLKTMAQYFLLLPLITFGIWVFHGPARILEQNTAFHVQSRFVRHFYQIVTSLPMEWHKNHHSGETISRLRKAYNGLYSFVSNGFQFVEMAMRLVGSIFVLTLLLPTAAIIAVTVSGVAFFIIFLFDRWLMPRYEAINVKEHYTASALHDYLTNITTVITLRLEKLTQSEIWRRLTEYFPLVRRTTMVNEWKWFLATVIIALMTVAVLAWYAWSTLSAGGILLAGTFFMLYDYLQKIGSAFYTFAWKYSDTVHQYADFRSAEDILRAEAISAFPRAYLPKDWRVIQVEDLCFTYEEKSGREHHLDEVMLTLRRGRKIALVGESGSGKSTIMALLRGLYTPSRVTVTCDGRLLKHGLRHLAPSVTLIPQDPEIFANTVEYNVTMDTAQAQEEVLEDVDLACFTSVLRRLPNGLQTNVVEKGVNLSGGEKQRLALARGFFAARDTDIILLDEPTSSVDSTNELKIYRNLFRRFADRCIVSSIHKLHLLPMFSDAYIIADGRVIEHGPVKKLLKGSGVLAGLWKKYNAEQRKTLRSHHGRR
ncbi:ABC transporter ATP-binding protein [Candidatus Peregrinibacteria bacterium]|nr:ABC transporter ATP-binding protein [Candidatus Peregrinibacteria bacterium]